MIGKVQFKNVLMAVIASIKSGINIEDIFNTIPKIKSVEGRFERVGRIKNNSKVILDYAHTPDALKTCLKNIKEQFPEIPHYIVSDATVKIPAGWLIETAGFKGKKFGSYGVHDKQALVLVNYGNASGKDLLQLSIQIQEAILIIFGIHLESEVNIL